MALLGGGAPGCGSKAASGGTPVLEGTYIPDDGAADGATSAALATITLGPSGHYSSVQAGCTSSACRSHGTFAFDGEHALTLTDAASHATRTVAIGSLSLAAAGGASSAVAALVSSAGGPLVDSDAGSGGSGGLVVDSATMDGVRMKRRRDAEQAPPRIFVSPNADPPLATDWQTPFAHPLKWPTTLASGTVIQLYESDIAAILSATPSFAQTVQNRGLQVSIEASPLMSDACDDAGYPSGKGMAAKEHFVADYTAAAMNLDFQPIYDAGASITYAQLDGDGIDPVTSTDPSDHCNFTVEQAATAQAYFLADMQTTHPEIQFGLIANFPNYNYIDTICYWNDATACARPFPGVDYADVLDTQLNIVEDAGQTLYFVHVDNPYNYLFNHPTLDDVMAERVVPLRDQVVSRGLRFGLILNTDLGASVSGAAGDQSFHDQTVADATNAATNGLGSEDDLIVESWFDYPSSILPETTPNTFAATANDAIAAFLAGSGR